MRKLMVPLVVAMFATVGPGCSDEETAPAGDGAVQDQGTRDGQPRTEAGADKGSGDGKVGGDGKTTADGKTADGPRADVFNPTNHPACNGNVYACADGKDNDGDKLIDALDPECTGPCDNDEGSFGINVPGANKAACQQDCYWDNDSGSGNDKCEWNLKCDPKSPGSVLKPPCPYDAKYSKCTKNQSSQCLTFCKPLVPNGCDCFGCCVIYTKAGKYKTPIFLGSGSTCSTKTPQNCAPCTPVTQCYNDCGDCELCLGKTLKDLPPKCFKRPGDAGVVGDGGKPGDGGGYDMVTGLPTNHCPPGASPCVVNANCPTNLYCVTGCCIPAPK